MSTRKVIQAGSLVWAGIAWGIALGNLGRVNADALLFVAVASVVLPAAAVGASLAFGRNRDRLGGALLVLSAGAPTYAAAALNVPALVVGLALLIAPRAVLRDRATVGATPS
jgi:hypothetical protein